MNDDGDGFELKTQNLDGLIKALKANQGRVRVGILGDKDGRSSGKALSNATVGHAQEYGDGEHPVRSFLRMPLSTHLDGAVENSQAFTKEELLEVVKVGTLKPWLVKLGVLAEKVISDAFDTGGFGAWKPSNMANKKNHQTLVETQQLRNSITSDVK